MNPLSAVRVLVPAITSVVTGLWAVLEWRASHNVVVDMTVGLPEPADVDDEWREREAWRRELADRQLRLQEAREARLAAREQRPGTPDDAA